MRHEEVAAFAAGADAHVTGSLAVCAGSCGPGNLHLINGLFDCHRTRVPVVAIAAQIPSPEIGSHYFQETHPERLFQECSSYCELVSTPEQMPARARDRGAPLDPRALRERRRRSRRRGAESRRSGVGAEARRARACSTHDHAVGPSLDALAQFLNSAERVTLLCGSGCAGAHAELCHSPSGESAGRARLGGKDHVEWETLMTSA